MRRVIRRKLKPIKLDPEVERQDELALAEALIRLRKKMELFDSLPKEVRQALTERSGGLEDLQHLQWWKMKRAPP